MGGAYPFTGGARRCERCAGRRRESRLQTVRADRFRLVDVDLYLPVKSALQLIAPHMSDGGVIIVDDCIPDNVFDGAWQAYVEWCEAHQIKTEIAHEKLGVLRF